MLDPVGVGVFAAGLGPVFVDAAGVVRLQKRTGKLPKHPVAVFVEAQVARLQFGRLHAEPLGHTFLVALGPKRAGGLAAVRAVQAVGARKNSVVQLVDYLVEVPGRLPLEPLEKLGGS